MVARPPASPTSHRRAAPQPPPPQEETPCACCSEQRSGFNAAHYCLCLCLWVSLMTSRTPRLVTPLLGFGSNAEGAMIRMNGSDQMLFSHAGDVNGTIGRWNMTIWSSTDSAATWYPAVQVEPDATITLHLAYSTMVQLSPTEVLVVWERGPLGGDCSGYPNCFRPSGEYQTLRARIVSLPPTNQ